MAVAESEPKTYVLRSDLLPEGSRYYLNLEDAKQDLLEFGCQLKQPGAYGYAKLSSHGQLIGTVSSPGYEWDYCGEPTPVAPIRRVMPWDAKQVEIRLR